MDDETEILKIGKQITQIIASSVAWCPQMTTMARQKTKTKNTKPSTYFICKPKPEENKQVHLGWTDFFLPEIFSSG